MTRYLIVKTDAQLMPEFLAENLIDWVPIVSEAKDFGSKIEAERHITEGNFNHLSKHYSLSVFVDNLTVLKLKNKPRATKKQGELFRELPVDYKEITAHQMEMINTNETASNRPDHYNDTPYPTAPVQLDPGFNTFKALIAKGVDEREAWESSVWTVFAMKHLIRCGKKDDPSVELAKARNYLNRALEGEWLDD